MKLATASLLLAGVHGFTFSPVTNDRRISSLRVTPDPYAPLLDKLNGHLSSASASSSSTVASPQVDTQQKLLDVLSSTLDAANDAIVASAQVSKLRPLGVGEVQPLPFMLEAQTKLAAIESQLHDLRTTSSPNEVDFSALYASLNSVLDTSIQAAEQAAHSSTEMVDKLVSFNVALGHSMGAFDVSSLPNMGEMLHAQLGGLTDGLPATSVAFNWNDAGFQSFLSTLDRKLDDLSFDVSSETAAALVGYGVIAFLVGYAQNMGIEEYELNLRRKMEIGEFDVEDLAKEVGYFKANMVTAITSSLASVDYDAAVRLAYKSSAKTISFDVFKAKYLLETSAMVAKKNPYVAVADLTPMPSVASVDYDAAARLAYVASGKTEEYDSFKAKYLIETSAMVAKKNPYVSMADLTPMQSVVDAHTTEASVDYDAAARFAYAASGKTEEFDSFKAKYLSETSAMVAKKNPYAQAKPAPPTQEITAESFMKQPMVKVVKKMVKPKRNVPAASPLARLLAEELGLKLENIGMGSGKNGKILIDDVRMFQSKLQQAKNAIAEKQPYFATANA